MSNGGIWFKCSWSILWSLPHNRQGAQSAYYVSYINTYSTVPAKAHQQPELSLRQLVSLFEYRYYARDRRVRGAQFG